MKKLISAALSMLLLCQCLVITQARADTERVKFTAVASIALKVRVEPDKNARGADSISRGSAVSILDLGAQWSKVRTKRMDGYVQTQYLDDIAFAVTKVGEDMGGGDAPASVALAQSNEEFKENFVSYAVRSTALREQPSANARNRKTINMYDQVIVSSNAGGWSHVNYKGYYGYAKTADLFKWDRIDAYAGPIPGCISYPLMAITRHSTDIIDYDNGKTVHKTINPGACLCVEEPDEYGRYKTPYWRKTGYITDDDIESLIEVVPYDKAEPGDLISVMTTYYALGIYSLQYQGRNWNIYLSTSFISGLTLGAGEQFNMNKVIGPYQKRTGYKPAPIASPTALWGYGGGTCQVNTTMYNTIIQLPIFVNHRKVHANAGAKYFLKGFDAAVGGGDINMIFTNTLPYAIRFLAAISDGVLTMCIFRA